MTDNTGMFRNSSLALIILCAAIGGCEQSKPGEGTAPKSEQRKTIVTTTGMITDVVREIVGDQAEVEGLIGEGIDPHLYQPTTSDIATLRDADVIFYNGLLLEGKMTDALVRLARDKPVYAVTELLDSDSLITPEDSEGHADPHVWMDVQLWSKSAEAVSKALSEINPDQKATFEANRDAYLSELTKLHEYVNKVIRSIPAEQRVLITAHDAFNYFGAAYDLEVIGIQGISTESEAGVDHINKLVDLLVERQVPAVFVETSVADKSVKALIEGAAARGHEVIIGGELFSDAMGAAGTYRGTYLGMIDHNATTIARALGGEAPEAGYAGKLAETPAQ